MDPALEWILRVIDQASGPTRHIMGNMAGLERQAQLTQASLEMMNLGAGMVGGGFAMAIPLVFAFMQASDLSESMSKNQQVFKGYATEIEEWAENSADAMGLSRNEAIAAASDFGNLFTALGLNQGVAAEYSMNLGQLAADLASFNNTNVPDALEAIRAGMTGEMEPLKRYGVALTDDLLKQEAFTQGLIATTKVDLTPAIKMQAAYSLMFKQTAVAQGDYARTASGAANTTRTLRAHALDLVTTLGEVLLPVGLAILTWLNRTVQRMQVWVDQNPVLSKVIMLTAVAVTALTTGLGSLILFMGLTVFAATQLSGALTMARVSATALQNALIFRVTGGVPTAQQATLMASSFGRLRLMAQGALLPVQTLFATLRAAVVSNPVILVITLVVLAIAGLALAFRHAWQASEQFRDSVRAALEPLKASFEALQGHITALKMQFHSMMLAFQTNPAFIKFRQGFETAIIVVAYSLGYLTGLLIRWGVQFVQWVMENFGFWIDFVTGAFMFVTGWLEGNHTKMQAGMQKMLTAIEGLWENSLLYKILGTIIGWGSAALQWMTSGVQGILDSLAGTASDWLEIGQTWISNLWDGISGRWSSLKKDVADLGWGIAETLSFGLIQNPNPREAANETGVLISTGLGDGILSDPHPELAIRQQGELVKEASRETFEVRSPSRVFQGIGQFLSQGLALGISDQAARAVASARQLSSSVVAAGAISLPAIAAPAMPDLPTVPTPASVMQNVAFTSTPQVDAPPLNVMGFDVQSLNLPEFQFAQPSIGFESPEMNPSFMTPMTGQLIPEMKEVPNAQKGSESKKGRSSGRPTIHIENLHLPGVTDANGFVAALGNFDSLLEGFDDDED